MGSGSLEKETTSNSKQKILESLMTMYCFKEEE